MNNVLGVFGQKEINIFGLRIAYYAICILIGAIVAYKLSQYFIKKRGYDPEALETLFYILHNFERNRKGFKQLFCFSTFQNDKK